MRFLAAFFAVTISLLSLAEYYGHGLAHPQIFIVAAVGVIVSLCITKFDS